MSSNLYCRLPRFRSIKHQLDGRLQRLEDPGPRGGPRLELGDVAPVEERVELGQRGDVRQVALVVLDHQGELVGVVPLFPEVHPEVLHRLLVRVHAGELRVGAEDDAVDAAQDEPAAGVVEDLAGNGVQVEARLEAADLPQRQREEVEKEGPLRLGGEGDHLPARLGVHPLVDELQVGRFPAQAGPVIDDLAVDLAGGVVDEGH